MDQIRKFISNEKYNIGDIVNIITPNSKFKSVYMGLIGGDDKDILNKLNYQFEKSNPFDGVFVLFNENLPKSFKEKEIKIFLINEYEIGKGKQIIKTYSNNGKFITKYNVLINKITLIKKGEVYNDLLKISKGPSILEKINSNFFQQFINKKNRYIKFEDFNVDIDFEEINN
jgi:hypothetical protein